MLGVSPKSRAVFVLLSIDVGNMVGKGQAILTHQLQMPGVVGLGQCATKVCPDALHAFGREWLRIERFVGVNAKGACVLVNAEAIGLHGFGRRVSLERVSAEVFPDGLGEQALVLVRFLCQTCQTYEQRQKQEGEISHSLVFVRKVKGRFSFGHIDNKKVFRCPLASKIQLFFFLRGVPTAFYDIFVKRKCEERGREIWRNHARFLPDVFAEIHIP